ncbi:NACHT, LRR and PYD domains-containing protein 1 homolog [Engraulis encrasicolus]|uniref:NACHT, LRR and PYD domains-containing protein 1 homolog n=1 Tax=Engraulis encrasicolus TaxID=184585 RepID=UPI002FD2FDFA
MDWYVFTKELAQMQCSPAGPLMDIKLMSGELEEIHLPHFLCLGGCQLALKDVVKVLHEQDGGVYLETCELTRHHARLIQPSLSPRGLLYDFTAWLFGKVHASVLVYQCSEFHLVFRCYLLPEDAHLKQKVELDEEKCGGVKKLYPSPNNSLQINEFYSLSVVKSTNCVYPDELMLRYSETPNFFQVELPDPPPAFFHMQLFSSASRQELCGSPVWRAKFQTATQGRQTRSRHLTQGIASGRCSACRIGGAVDGRGEGEAGGVETIDGPSQPSKVPDSQIVAFVDGNMAKIIDRVAGVMSIADQLFPQGILGQETYADIQAAATSQAKMRKLYDGLRSAGAKGKLAFYRILQAQEPHLVEELWTAE